MIGNYKGKIKSSSQMRMTRWGDWEGTGEEGLLAACGWEVDAEILVSKDVPLNVNSVRKLPKQGQQAGGDVMSQQAAPSQLLAPAACPWLDQSKYSKLWGYFREHHHQLISAGMLLSQREGVRLPMLRPLPSARE